jgi:predicted transcriptional regulator
VEKTTVYLDPVAKREIEALAKRSGRPQAELIRQALVEFIDGQRRPSLPTFVATAAVGGDAVDDVASRRPGAVR